MILQCYPVLQVLHFGGEWGDEHKDPQLTPKSPYCACPTLQEGQEPSQTLESLGAAQTRLLRWGRGTTQQLGPGLVRCTQPCMQTCAHTHMCTYTL